MTNKLTTYPGVPIQNPANRQVVTPEQIDIFTARIVPNNNNSQLTGRKRKPGNNYTRNNLPGSNVKRRTRKNRKMRKTRKQRR